MKALLKPFKAWWKNLTCQHPNRAAIVKLHAYYHLKDIDAHGGMRSRWQCLLCHEDRLYSWHPEHYVPERADLRKWTFAAVIAILLVSSPALAQTHPCDGPLAQTPVASGAPLKVEFCARPADTPETAIVRIDAVVYAPQPITQLSAQNAAGLALYQTTNVFQVTRGSHVATMSLTNRNDLGELQEGPLSSPFPFDAVDPKAPPAAPVIKRVIR